jgi:leader peptidase (prepilin peptidase)/N-methyltransferase
MNGPLLWTWAFAVGLALGSFLNVCVYRWPAGQSVLRPRSRCPGCGTMVAWHDNVPVLGWVALRGRCRHCAMPLSVQYPLVELAVAVIWMGAAMRLGPTVAALTSATFLTLLLGIALTDAREMIIPDQFSLGGTVLGLALAAWPGGMAFRSALLGAAASYAILWAIKLVAERLLRKPALGVGDIHMMAMVGAFLGLPGALLTLLLGAALGLVIGVPVSALRGRLEAMGTYLPLGVFLAMGALVAHTFGERIINWYIALVLGV